MHSRDAAGGAALSGLDHNNLARGTVARSNTTDAP